LRNVGVTNIGFANTCARSLASLRTSVGESDLEHEVRSEPNTHHLLIKPDKLEPVLSVLPQKSLTAPKRKWRYQVRGTRPSQHTSVRPDMLPILK